MLGILRKRSAGACPGSRATARAELSPSVSDGRRRSSSLPAGWVWAQLETGGRAQPGLLRGSCSCWDRGQVCSQPAFPSSSSGLAAGSPSCPGQSYCEHPLVLLPRPSLQRSRSPWQSNKDARGILNTSPKPLLLMSGFCASFPSTCSDLSEMLYVVVVSKCLLSWERLVEIEIQT